MPVPSTHRLAAGNAGLSHSVILAGTTHPVVVDCQTLPCRPNFFARAMAGGWVAVQVHILKPGHDVTLETFGERLHPDVSDVVMAEPNVFTIGQLHAHERSAK